MDQPPVDPQDWTDEQWLEWLESTDGEAVVPHETTVGEERGSVRERVKSSPAGRSLGGAMIALQEIFYKPKDEEVVIVARAAGDPPDPGRLTLDLDPDHPEASTATVPAHRLKPGEGDRH